MKFSVVLFDLDGTLINTNDLIVATFQHVLREKLGLEVPPAAIHQYFGEPLPVTLGRYAPDRAEELTEFYRVWNKANHDILIRNFEGIREMLQALKDAGVKLGIVTSKMRVGAFRGLRACGLEGFFDTVVGLDDTERHKPDPAPALLALERLGERPGDHVLFVGDSHFDILCGRGAGVQTAAVGWTMLVREQLAKAQPHHWVEDPTELAALVLGA